MSSTSDSQSDAVLNEELVAYLDGELSPEESRRVEERLAADADYRQQLRDLDQAWEALNALPSTNVDDNFARTTIEMVTVAAQHDIEQRQEQVAAANRSRAAFWIAGCLAVAALGFGATRWLLPDANDSLVANLPAIYQVDVLSQIDDVEFLRKLATEVPYEQLAPDPAAIERELETWNLIASATAQGRRDWLDELPPDQKANLTEQVNRFNNLAPVPEKQERLEQLERTIRQDDHADQLQKTLLAYSSWVGLRRPGDQEDLRVLPADKRIEMIRRLVREDEERALRHLSDEDAAKLRSEILEIYAERKSSFERSMRRRDDDNRLRLDGPPLRRAWMVVLWELWNDDRDDKTTDRFVEQLSAEQQQYWNTLRRRDRHDRRREQLVRWIGESMRPRWGPEELERFFTEKLDNNQRKRLLTLPGDEMQAQLERLYIADELGLRGEEWLAEFGGGPGLPPGTPPGPGGPGRSGEGRNRDRDGDRDRDRGRRDGPRDGSGPGRPEPGPDGPRRPPPGERGDQPPPDRPPPPGLDAPPPDNPPRPNDEPQPQS